MNDTSKCSDYLKTYFVQEYKQDSWVTYSCYGTATITALTVIPALFLNILVITAIFRSRTLRTPSFLLLSSLSFTDVIVGLFAQPRYVALRIIELMGDIGLYCRIAKLASVNSVIPLASLLMASAISIDRYLAIHLSIRYSTTVTKTRTRGVIILLWAISACLGFVIPLLSSYGFAAIIAVMLPTLLIVITICYWKSFKALRRHKNRIGTEEQNTPGIDLVKYEKVSRTMLLVVGFLFLCYAPYAVVLLIALPVVGYNGATKFGTDVGMAIIYLNSTLNPVLYLVRVREIRRSCSKLLSKCNPFASSVGKPESLSTTLQAWQA